MQLRESDDGRLVWRHEDGLERIARCGRTVVHLTHNARIVTPRSEGHHHAHAYLYPIDHIVGYEVGVRICHRQRQEDVGVKHDQNSTAAENIHVFDRTP